VGIRYDHADLNDNDINGGVLDAVTLGVNWFLNPNMKLQLNCDWTHRGDVTTNPAPGVFFTTDAGDIYGLGTRVAIDF
jgi:phosphate-selective porin OprO/OprP